MTFDAAGMPADFLDAPLRLLAANPTFAEFAAAMAAEMARVMPGDRSEAEERAIATAFAREIWRVAPDPLNGWRARPAVARIGRNDPCDCGSGLKFKRCCEPHAGPRPHGMTTAGVAGLMFRAGPAAWREPHALRGMPPLLLAAAADAWRDQHGDRALADLLEPVFLEPDGLVDAHEAAFDLLMEALLDSGLEERRDRIARTVAERARSRALRCTALSRIATMASDRGELAAAWEAFHEAQKAQPDHPQLLHLELLLLLTEGRREEARLRGPLLAARARKAGEPELAGMLSRMAQEGLEAVGGPAGEDDRDRVALLQAPIGHLAAATFLRLHRVEATGDQLVVTLAPAGRRLVKPWTSRFACDPPMLAGLHGAAGELLAGAQEARDWLLQNPDAVSTLPVLDDLLVAAREMSQESAGVSVDAAALELALAAADMVVTALQAWPDARIHWTDQANRPLLRIVSQAIDIALEAGQDDRAIALIRWMLRRNPDDNHGWREVLRQRLLQARDGEGALAVLDAYPDDMPPAAHERALALFLLGRRDEAEAALRAAHAEHPVFLDALLPDRLDRPAGTMEGLHSLGGADHAWQWRQQVRETWRRHGALDWARSLGLAAAPKNRRAAGAGPAAGRAPTAAAPAQDPGAVLRAHYGARLPWALGWLACFAWGPGMVMPAQWLGGVLAAGEEAGSTARLQERAEAVIAQYNHMNTARLDRAQDVPLPAGIEPGDDAGWVAFAAGFVQAAETHGRPAWRGVASVRVADPLFGPLYQLAARAGPGPDGWRASTETSAPLLALAADTEPARELLVHALQPLWRASVGSRR